jgi:hypothetical protein
MNPWKLTAVAMGLVMMTALVTGLVVANWTGTEPDRKVQVESKPAAARPARPGAAQATAPRPLASPVAPSQPAVPTQAAIDACNRYAAQQTGQGDKTLEVVKDAAVGAVVGAAMGAAGGAIADGGSGAGKGAAIGGVVGAGAGTLYGLNENKKRDQRYRDNYAACMRSRGYTG